MTLTMQSQIMMIQRKFLEKNTKALQVQMKSYKHYQIEQDLYLGLKLNQQEKGLIENQKLKVNQKVKLRLKANLDQKLKVKLNQLNEDPLEKQRNVNQIQALWILFYR